MKKIYVILVVLLAFVALTCTNGVASAYLSTEYVGNTMVNLSWYRHQSTDFSKYELCRDGVRIPIKDRTVTFYRDTGLTKGVTYTYELRVYNATGRLKQYTSTTSVKAGDVHGDITIDTSWTAASSPYDLTGGVRVLNGANLTIEKGVMVTSTSGDTGYEAILVGYLPIPTIRSTFEKGALYADGVSFYDVQVTIHGHAEIRNCFFEDASINVRYSNNNVITGNTVLNNSWRYGIFLYTSSNNVITDNTVSNNGDWGIWLSSSSNNTLTGNTVSNNNDTGILLSSSSDNTIYNNYFNNTNNACELDRDGNNTWNIQKTAGSNIVGGPYLGGNYWSDYAGDDLDGDMLGDTLLPYTSSWGIENGGDYHPLIKKIINVTASPEELPANGMNKSLITAIVANQTGPVVGVKVSFSLDNTSLGKLEPLTAKTNESGIATSNFTVGTIPGVVNVTANESKTHASDSVKIILGMIKINHTSSTYQFIPTPCRNATINFEIKPVLLRDSPETNVSMIIQAVPQLLNNQ